MASSPVQAPKGTLIAFSTSPNDGASDVGFEGHSIFTGALLKYIGRERISVEELFKKVRKTVHNLSNEKQTTWEHTSLIGDFYFNTGQLIHSVEIPYSDDVVKDINYNKDDEFGNLIKEIKSYDWNIQNPAIGNALRMKADSLNKNQKFILGRNLLQSSGAAFRAESFMDNLPTELSKYSDGDGENHVLNGILFEIYFNPQAEFRKDKTKMHSFDNIIALRKNPKFSKSFEFIRSLLISADYPLIYIPSNEEEIFDIDVVANVETDSLSGRDRTFQKISKITFNSTDITKAISKHYVYWKTEQEFKEILSQYLCTPIKMLQINANIKLDSIFMDMYRGE